MRRVPGALSAVIVSLAAEGCASRPAGTVAAAPTPLPTQAPTPAPTPSQASSLRFVTLAEAEPALLSLEDRRAYEAPPLEAAASCSDPSVRARAALALGRIGDARASAALRALLGDPSPQVRLAAAFACGILGEPSLTAELAGALADPDARVAARAAWSLGRLEQPAGEAALLAALPQAPPGRKPSLLFALWRFSTAETSAAVQPFASDPDPAVRVAALYALSRRPREASLPVLTACLSEPDADAAAQCARALGVLGKVDSIGPLAAALEDRRAGVLINAMIALRAVLEKNPAAAAPLEKAARLSSLASNANPNLAVPALALLRFWTEDREAFRRLWSAASAGAGRRRQVALQAVMAALPQQSVSLVDAAMASPDPFLRAAAAEGLGSLPEADAAPRRAKLAADPEPFVRLEVLEGLPTPEAIRANRTLVDALLADTDAAVRASALDAEAKARGGEAFDLLREAVVASYGEPSPDVPMAAISAAEQAGSPEARGIVEAAYGHPSVLVSRLARRALVTTFHADPAEYPWRAYETGKSVEDYATLLAAAKRPWTARVETARGVFTIRLLGAEAPMTVMNLVALARKGYFDGAPIHRVVPNFVVQDGDPTGTGSGGPGYEIRDELNPLPYRAGTLGMALAGADTGGSQWFLTQSPQPHLDGTYTVFGQLVSGTDTVGRIEQDDRVLSVTVSEGTS